MKAANRHPARRLSHLFLVCMLLLMLGCASSRYMLDDPVNDPIMTTDEEQDADLCKVEDGGYSGAGGECPT